MPQGKVHLRVNLILALPLGTALFYFACHPSKQALTIFTLTLIYNILVFNPDIDMARYVKPLSFKGVFYFPFIPYSWIFKHRGISHSIILGTASRIAYLIVLIWTANYLVNGENLTIFQNVNIYGNVISLWPTSILALYYGDLWHIVLDRYWKA